MTEEAQDPRVVIQGRLEELTAHREELVEQLQKEMALALSPLDASIKELRWMLSQLDGNGATPPQYQLVKRSPARPSPIQQDGQAAAVQFAPARPAPKGVEPVRSPKTNTPVDTNVAILKKKLRGS